MAANSLWYPPSSISSLRIKPQYTASPKRFFSCSSSLPSSFHFLSHPTTSFPSSSSLKPQSRKSRVSSAFPVVNEESAVAEGFDGVELQNDDVSGEESPKNVARPCEIYVCNLPRSCDSTQLHDMFKPFGTVLSAEVFASFHLLIF